MPIIRAPISDNELRLRLQAAATGDPHPAHQFFAQFEYNDNLQRGDLLNTYDKIISLLQHLSELDAQAYERIHKGVPFYFGAMCAFILHKYQDAVYLFDAAASEDIKNDPGQRTPAILFMALDANNPDQAAKQLTEIADRKLGNFVDVYNKVIGSQAITSQEVKSRFLEHAVSDRLEWRTQATAWISFLLEWNYLYILQDIRGQAGTWEPFYMHLFKGCVLFESLLKANPTEAVPQDTLSRILNQNWGIRNRLGIVERITTRATFPGLLANLPGAGSNMQTAIEFVARLRNTIGHNLGWNVAILPEQYIQMVVRVTNVCLHTISTLY